MLPSWKKHHFVLYRSSIYRKIEDEALQRKEQVSFFWKFVRNKGWGHDKSFQLDGDLFFVVQCQNQHVLFRWWPETYSPLWWLVKKIHFMCSFSKIRMSKTLSITFVLWFQNLVINKAWFWDHCRYVGQGVHRDWEWWPTEANVCKAEMWD